MSLIANPQARKTPMHERPRDAATDVGELITDLDAGQFDAALSVALSQVAAAVVDHRDRKGKVRVDMLFEHIAGTSQVRLEHTVRFERPTIQGKASEETTGATVLHVSKGGRLSLSQPDLFDRKQQQIPS